jgi:hypothetical protein
MGWALSRCRLILMVIACGALAASSGCGQCLAGSPSTGTVCTTTGHGTLAAAPGLSASKPLYVRFGQTCLPPMNCFGGLSFSARDTPTDPPGFEFDVQLPGMSGDFTVSPPSATGAWSPGGPGMPLDSLTFVSGTAAVHGASQSGFTADFALEFLTDAGAPVSVTDGQAVVSGCHSVTSCGE